MMIKSWGNSRTKYFNKCKMTSLLQMLVIFSFKLLVSLALILRRILSCLKMKTGLLIRDDHMLLTQKKGEEHSSIWNMNLKVNKLILPKNLTTSKCLTLHSTRSQLNLRWVDSNPISKSLRVLNRIIGKLFGQWSTSSKVLRENVRKLPMLRKMR